MENHKCDLDEIIWNTEPEVESECVIFVGKCEFCGKRYEDVYSPSGIWDPENKEYVRNR